MTLSLKTGLEALSSADIFLLETAFKYQIISAQEFRQMAFQEVSDALKTEGLHP